MRAAVCWNQRDTGIGQVGETLVGHLDDLSPMLYPSSFQFGIPGYPKCGREVRRQWLDALESEQRLFTAEAFRRSPGKYCVRGELSAYVEFVEQDIRRAMPDGRSHLILCRNLVRTYFEEALQRAILDRMTDRLLPDGAMSYGLGEPVPMACSDSSPGRRGSESFAAARYRGVTGTLMGSRSILAAAARSPRRRARLPAHRTSSGSRPDGRCRPRAPHR